MLFVYRDREIEKVHLFGNVLRMLCELEHGYLVSRKAVQDGKKT